METEALENLGLTKNQSETYLSLLKLGEATAQQIIVESGMHRSRVYDSLEKLESLGLVSSVIKDFKRYFSAVSPEKLLDYLEEKKQKLRQALPEIKNLENMKKAEISGSVYKGKEGLKTIHSEMLKVGKDIYVLGGKGMILSELEFFMPNFERERLKKKIKWIVLADNESVKQKIDKIKLLKSRVLPQGYDSKSTVNIFGNKIAIVNWKERYPTAFMIENKDTADSFRKWFKLMWNHAKK